MCIRDSLWGDTAPRTYPHSNSRIGPKVRHDIQPTIIRRRCSLATRSLAIMSGEEFLVVVTLQPKPLSSLHLDRRFTRIDYTPRWVIVSPRPKRHSTVSIVLYQVPSSGHACSNRWWRSATDLPNRAMSGANVSHLIY